MRNQSPKSCINLPIEFGNWSKIEKIEAEVQVNQMLQIKQRRIYLTTKSGLQTGYTPTQWQQSSSAAAAQEESRLKGSSRSFLKLRRACRSLSMQRTTDSAVHKLRWMVRNKRKRIKVTAIILNQTSIVLMLL